MAVDAIPTTIHNGFVRFKFWSPSQLRFFQFYGTVAHCDKSDNPHASIPSSSSSYINFDALEIIMGRTIQTAKRSLNGRVVKKAPDTQLSSSTRAVNRGTANARRRETTVPVKAYCVWVSPLS
jgi:hypothetical protein